MKKMAAAVITLGILVSAPRGSLAAPEKSFLWEGPVAAGKQLHVSGIHGPIQAVRGKGRSAIVRATLSSRKGDPESVRIEQYESGNSIYFCAIHPGDRTGSPNPCQSINHTSDEDPEETVWVEWEIEVPDGVALKAITVNGDIEIEGLTGKVKATTVNGSIVVATRDVAEATTVNGTIEARLGASKLTEDLSFKTVNGSVVLELADGLGAEVHAEALNGSFDSDFPLTVSGKIRKNKLRGTINGGGALLSMTTVNGSVAIRRHSSASK